MNKKTPKMRAAFLALVVFSITTLKRYNIMLSSFFDEKNKFFDLELNIASTDPDIKNLPAEIKSSKQFCLWRYEFIAGNTKPLKIPYGYSKDDEKLFRSLKDKRGWFTFGEFMSFRHHSVPTYCNLGLVLTGGPFTVIDIDKYQKHRALDEMLFKLLKKNAYIEISPSGQGLHIFYQGSWNNKRNKGTSYLYSNEKQITCEVYSGKDIRFITLTGQKLFHPDYKSNKPLVSALDISSELKLLEELFFNVVKNDSSSSVSYSDSSSLKLSERFTDNYCNDQFQENYSQVNLNTLDRTYQLIKSVILDSQRFVSQYSDLCQNINTSYHSPSEADWTFLSIIIKFIPQNSSLGYKYRILEYFFQKDRPGRSKKNRYDYVDRTIRKIIDFYSQKKPSVDQLSAYNHTKSISTRTSAVKQTILTQPKQCNLPNTKQNHANLRPSGELNQIGQANKGSILKICNTMKIFHLGRSVNNIEYINSKSGNYLKATIPVSLNETDLVNYIGILSQIAEQSSHKDYGNLKDNYFSINIQQLLNKAQKTISGKSYKNFINTLDKLARITVAYDKQISTKGLRSREVGSFLHYKYQYQKKDDSGTLSANKKLLVKVHSSILDIIYQSDYNYTLLNKKIFYALDNNQLRLLYYYFSLSTLPGLFSQKFSLDSLLNLWPESQNKLTIFRRKQALYKILEELIKNKDQMYDLNIALHQEMGKVVSVTVKRRKLKLV